MILLSSLLIDKSQKPDRQDMPVFRCNPDYHARHRLRKAFIIVMVPLTEHN